MGAGGGREGGGCFQNGPTREKGVLELEITKKHIFFKRRTFSSCTGGKRKSGVFRSCQGQKWGAFRHIPVLTQYGSTPSPPPGLNASVDRTNASTIEV